MSLATWITSFLTGLLCAGVALVISRWLWAGPKAHVDLRIIGPDGQDIMRYDCAALAAVYKYGNATTLGPWVRATGSWWQLAEIYSPFDGGSYSVVMKAHDADG
jgi:hypothetical protein